MPEASRFHFRSAALGRPTDAEITDTALVLREASGAIVDEIAFDEISGMRYSRRTVRQIRFAYLDLAHTRGKALRLASTVPVGSWDGEADSIAFCDCVETLTGRLAELRPDLTVSLGDSSHWQLAWFGLALSMAVFGFGLPIFAFMENVDPDRMVVVTPVMVLMGAFGAFLAWTSRPWRKPVNIAVGAFKTEASSLIPRRESEAVADG